MRRGYFLLCIELKKGMFRLVETSEPRFRQKEVEAMLYQTGLPVIGWPP